LQKSTREGFGLTVTEAMWRSKPVIGGAVGGLPSQILHGVTGFLVHSPDGAAFRLRYLLSHPRAAERMGEHGREHVRRNFLITRHVRDYLLLMLQVLHGCHDQPIRVGGRTTAERSTYCTRDVFRRMVSLSFYARLSMRAHGTLESSMRGKQASG
jgi:hypothetical protein